MPTTLFSESTTAIAPEVGLGEQVDRLRRVLLTGDGGHVGVHDLGGGLHRWRGYSTAEAGSIPTGIESITSVATTDSAAPIRSAASRPARAWARTAGAGGGEGLEAAGEQRGDDPGEHVAGPGGRQRRGGEDVDREPLAVGDDRVVALEDDDRAGGASGLAGAGEPVGGDLLGVAAEQAAELAGVRGEDGRRRAVPRSARVARRRR